MSLLLTSFFLGILTSSAWGLTCHNWCKDPDRPVIVVGAGISGLAAARTLTDAGCKVKVIEGRDHIGGRMWSETQSDGWVFHHGANWVHGADQNPLWQLNEKHHFFDTQWLPRTYLIKTPNGYISREGNDSFVPGQDLRDDYNDFVSMMSGYDEFVESVANGSYSVPDIPFTFYLTEYIRARQLSGDSLEEFFLFNYVYQTVDLAWDLFDVGMATPYKMYGLDKEWMVSPGNWSIGYNAINHFLSKGLDISLNTIVKGVSYGDNGVTVHTSEGDVQGQVAVITVPVGVLAKGAITFDPVLPPWKLMAIQTTPMGLLDKMALKWEKPWWPEFDAFWKTRDGETNRETANEWYNIHQLNGGNGPAVLLCTPSGYYAQSLERKSDNEVISILVAELQTIFPNVTIPPPQYLKRTKWRQDPFAYGSYTFPKTGMDPLVFDYLAEPIGNRLFWAGEHTGLDLRPSYADGAYVSGLREGSRIANLCNGEPNLPFLPPAPLYRPPNDAAIREAWYERIKTGGAQPSFDGKLHSQPGKTRIGARKLRGPY